ncbi:MAG: AAA domain-containing protein [Cytophagales bacterium]|nr:AAA domain-containing protein [Cytophagales bacterium]
MDFTEHFAHLNDLLKKERIADREQYEQKIRNRSITDRRKDGATWYPVTVNQSRLGTGERWIVSVERTQEVGRRHLFQVGASVSLFLAEEKVTRSANGVVSRLGENNMTIVLNRDDPPDWLDDGKLGVDLLFDESTYDEMAKTLRRLKKLEKGRTLELIPFLLGQKEPTYREVNPHQGVGLNDSQNEAVSRVIGTNEFATIHGPPGTGKTTTLVEAISAVLQTENQVLVCAPSNAAVDLLVERLHQQEISVLRLGHPGRVDEEVLSHTLDVQLSQHADAKMLKDLRKKSEEFKKLGFKYKRKFGREERAQRQMLLDEAKKLKEDAMHLEDHMIYQLLQEAQVVACTLIGANSDYLRNRSFSTLFVDECSQALEPANWVPILKAHRVIMAGDHQQLAPTVKSNEAAKEGLETTIFGRCIKAYGSTSMLKVQYRMQPQILEFSNQKFYNGEMETGENVFNRRQVFEKTLTFIDTAGCGFDEEINPETLSTFNKEQGLFSLKLVDLLLEKYPDAANMSIGLIAPYRAHLEVLRQGIVHYSWYEELQKQITIQSVDGFQGQERDIMLIDLVRSNPNGVVGFLSEIRRTNVAMTRARFRLIIVGDSATLSNHKFYDELIAFCQEKGSYESAFEYLY